ncbi:hypothetical protein SELMODRAFT_109892 [Selaginella moellendorffii]|uniref:NADP-dependent oxidoreductase domain-containing protein n=1 Tax=Selaginella moellendorffii TaxID=88036 RepID=D8S6H2_SELML|nr:L-galactose dehydrogenase [Selaginella moellendorffii]XP_024539834.1 L-galactose dehydrogenase [Selaginella moellendorffii]EFJ19944.1 hypothetical protein SELMODRAFT_109892 [Selaginella moellendorffii]|eukprot:XP_002978987.1 L-galactose dehydrogenase [Selaginella moellendorffii]
MKYTKLGSTGLEVSSLGFGGAPLGSVFGPVSEESAIESVREAIRLGINFFDVSPCYGNAETVLGRALESIPREKFVVSTKCGRYSDGFDFSAQRVLKSVDESLERLKLDYIDIIHCHDIEFGSLDQVISETIPALLGLKRQGKVRFIGMSGLPLAIFRYVLDRVEPGTIDVILSYCHYSLNDSSLEGLIPYLKDKGVGIITASPLAMGLLTESGPPQWHPAPEEIKEACAKAATHCKLKGQNISEMALKFSLSNPDIAITLVGMCTTQQVHENIKAMDNLERSSVDCENILDEVKEILAPIKNKTWPCGRPENN